MNTLTQDVGFIVMEYVPGRHGMHAVDAVDATVIAYVPTEQEVHAVVIDEEAYVPAGQREH